jgi:tight adherence protein B
MRTLIVALCGGGAGLGVLVAVAAWRGEMSATSGPGWKDRLARVERAQLRVLLATAAGIAALAVTGWPAAGAIGAAVGWSGPGLMGASRRRHQAMARTEAVAAWAEMLRDTLAAGGLREAILASRRVAPAPIAAEVAALAERSEYAPLGVALRQFAHAVDDPVADHVVAALVVATERQASGLRDMLGRIAGSAREQAGMRMRIEAGRARTYSQARFVVGFTPLFAIGVALMSPGYFTPFGTAVGQVVLIAVGAAFIASLWGLQRLAEPASTVRLLGQVADTAAPAAARVTRFTTVAAAAGGDRGR